MLVGMCLFCKVLRRMELCDKIETEKIFFFMVRLRLFVVYKGEGLNLWKGENVCKTV